jgi:toxin ParE1/3/4
MKKLIRIDAEAEEEISLAIDHYDRERAGLGEDFWQTLSRALEALEEPGPECGYVFGLPRELGVRRKLLARFPYAIVFIEGERAVRILSVMHGHRRPAYWRRRLQ